MSRLLRNDLASDAASTGGFVLRRGEAAFRPRVAQSEATNDFAPTGFAEESEQGPASAPADPYEAGIAEGRRVAGLEYAAERDALARLAESLEVLRPEPTNALALLLAETVDRLVREVIGQVEIDAMVLLERAKAAAALIGENVEPSKLRAHPDDVAVLASARLDIPVEPDPALERGGIVLETGHGWIEDGPAVRLERLRAELDKMAAPK
jgi:flagellar assembly protein FliH